MRSGQFATPLFLDKLFGRAQCQNHDTGQAANRTVHCLLGQFHITTMKRIIIIGIVSLIVCGAACASYLLGYQRGYHRALILQTGTFVDTLNALDEIRAGDVVGGTKTIEVLCFSSANIIYGDFVFRHDFPGHFVGKSMIDDLQHYRQTYRTNSAEWTPMERSLEKNLSNWK
jgi:hypothetical protein